MYRLRFYAWLEKDGRFVMDEPIARLLMAWDRGGSLAAACREVGVDPRRGRNLAKAVEDGLGSPVVQRSTVRQGLTPRARKALREFQNRSGALHVHLAGGERTPVLSVDGIVLYQGKLVLVRRRYPPFEGYPCLPGGIVEYGERLEHAVVREVREETGLGTQVEGLVGVYSDPKRDPRGHNVSTAFALNVTRGRPRAGDDARGLEFHPLDDLPPLGFDHGKMLADFRAYQRRGRAASR